MNEYTTSNQKSDYHAISDTNKNKNKNLYPHPENLNKVDYDWVYDSSNGSDEISLPNSDVSRGDLQKSKVIFLSFVLISAFQNEIKSSVSKRTSDYCGRYLWSKEYR